MKIDVQVNQEDQTIEITKKNGVVTITRGDITKTFQVKKTSSGYLLQHKDQIFHTNLAHRVNEQVLINVNDKTLPLAWKDPYEIYAAQGSNVGKGEIKAVMPGRVVKIMAKVGDQVSQGQSLLVLEAMKMENEIKAPKDGTISEVKISEGQSVESGTLLVLIE